MATTDTRTGNRVAIVTGGSGGIGRQTAERLAADGMTVVINYAGNPAEAESAVAEIEKGGIQGERHGLRDHAPGGRGCAPVDRRCSDDAA
jgi:3-oxoacyl-[acyl-carrier protein] reductase